MLGQCLNPLPNKDLLTAEELRESNDAVDKYQHKVDSGYGDVMGRRGNPNWGKRVPFGPVVPTVTSFENAVNKLKLRPEQYVHSTRLRGVGRAEQVLQLHPRVLVTSMGLRDEEAAFHFIFHWSQEVLADS